MSKIKEMAELYRKGEEVVILAEMDGQKYTDFEGASILNSINAQEPRTGMQTRNPDGSLASTGKMVHAVNPDYFYANRYKVKGKKLYVVSGHTPDGYRCIKEQASGKVYLKTIPAYVIARDSDGKLVLEKQTIISDTEFISDFTSKLDNKSMAEVLPLIIDDGKGMSADAMPI